MKVKRLTTINEVLHLWDFFETGLKQVNKYLRYDHSMDTYRKIIFDLVRRENAWVGVGFLSGHPISFVIAHEVTPLFSSSREMEVSLLFHQPDFTEATEVLQQAFEEWCREQKVKRYYATTRRDSGAAIRCYQSKKYGLKRAYTVFKKEL